MSLMSSSASCVLAALALLASGAAPVRAEEPFQRPDFTGSWELDLDASERVGTLLKALGRSWLEQRAADSVRVTQHILQTEETVTITIDTSLRDSREVLTLDGAPRSLTTEKGHVVSSRTYWEGDSVLVTETDAVLASGKRGSFRILRSLIDGGQTLLQRLELQVPGAERIVANRILRRAG